MICQNCQEEKDESLFSVRNDRSSRLRPYCRDCANNASKARYSYYKRSSPFRHRCCRAKQRAVQLKLDFDLTAEYLESIWTGKCPVLGIELDLNVERESEEAVELDRFIPSKGYTKGNVTWISRKANRIKNNTSIGELEKLLEWMKSRESRTT